MYSSLLFPLVLVLASLVGWNVFPQRIERDVAEWEITQQQGRRDIFAYRCSCAVLATVGVAFVLLALWND